MVRMLDWDTNVYPEMAWPNETRQRPAEPIEEIHDRVVAEKALSARDPDAQLLVKV